MTNVGLNDLKERIRNICLYPPNGMTVEELYCWIRGAEQMQESVDDLIKDLEEGQHD